MHVTLVNVRVLPQHAPIIWLPFRKPGNVRFDVLQSTEEDKVFILYEAYISVAAAAAHKASAHYLSWRDTVAPWIEAPRHSVTYKGLYPACP